jgi:hypothetical protein
VQLNIHGIVTIVSASVSVILTIGTLNIFSMRPPL